MIYAKYLAPFVLQIANFFLSGKHCARSACPSQSASVYDEVPVAHIAACYVSEPR